MLSSHSHRSAPTHPAASFVFARLPAGPFAVRANPGRERLSPDDADADAAVASPPSSPCEPRPNSASSSSSSSSAAARLDDADPFAADPAPLPWSLLPVPAARLFAAAAALLPLLPRAGELAAEPLVPELRKPLHIRRHRKRATASRKSVRRALQCEASLVQQHTLRPLTGHGQTWLLLEMPAGRWAGVRSGL